MLNNEFIRRVVVGSTLAAGVGVAGMLGAGAASAAPGISYDGGPGDPIGFGDTSATGAQASASDNNKALAISIFRPAKATADGFNRFENTALAIDGTAGFLKNYDNDAPDDHNNRVVAINGTAMAHGEWTNVFAVGSKVANRSTGAIGENGGTSYVYSRAFSTLLVPVRSTVIAVCGQRLAGNQDVFEVSGNITCTS